MTRKIKYLRHKLQVEVSAFPINSRGEIKLICSSCFQFAQMLLGRNKPFWKTNYILHYILCKVLHFLYFFFFLLFRVFCYFFPVKMNCRLHSMVGQGGELASCQHFTLHSVWFLCRSCFRVCLAETHTIKQQKPFTAVNQHWSVGKNSILSQLSLWSFHHRHNFCAEQTSHRSCTGPTSLQRFPRAGIPAPFRIKKSSHLAIPSNFINLFLDVLKPCKFACSLKQANK